MSKKRKISQNIFFKLIDKQCISYWHTLGIPVSTKTNVPQMKTLSTLFVSLLCFGIANAKDNTSSVEITNTTVIPATTLSTGGNENTVVLNWTAINEKSNVRYEIERSFYTDNFTSIATLVIPFSNESENSYSISDKAADLSGRAVACYRIKQIAEDGSVIYSNVKVVNLKETNALTVKSNTVVNFSAAQNGNAVIKIKAASGCVNKTITTVVAKGGNKLELNNLTGIAKGMYVAEVAVNGELVATQKIIIE